MNDNYLLIGRRIDAKTSVDKYPTLVKEYYDLGCRFIVIRQDFGLVSQMEAARQLAKKAKICQDQGIVPIIRPVLNEYPAFRLNQVSSFFETSLRYLMESLAEEDVYFEGSLLCVSTIQEGSEI